MYPPCLLARSRKSRNFGDSVSGKPKISLDNDDRSSAGIAPYRHYIDQSEFLQSINVRGCLVTPPSNGKVKLA